ncbi:MAG: glycogen synthase [Armatimonadota bacterium]
MKVLVAAAEAAPLAKTGGLADVAGSLPIALAERGVDARLALPCYRGAAERAERPPQKVGDIRVAIDGVEVPGALLETTLGDGTVPAYLVENGDYYDRDQLFGYPDDFQRFTFFCRAAQGMFELLHWQPDVIHCNDWHTGLIPVDVLMGAAGGPRTLFTIHNLGYQSPFPRERVGVPGFAWGSKGFRLLEMGDSLNVMKGGIVAADFVSTVSPQYAEEIRRLEFGAGLDHLLRAREDRLVGIINGIDYEEWNPRTDPDIAETYGPDSLEGKLACKRALQQENGLEASDAPLLGIVSRLAGQKGFDLLVPIMREVLGLGAQFVLLGTGDPEYHRAFSKLAEEFPGQVGVNLLYDAAMAKRIYAGCDMFLMPSRYEPCGLGQMISLAYGTIPVVRATGGLADTIREHGEASNGFVFFDYSQDALLAAIGRAVEAYGDGERWQALVQRAFQCDFSWSQSASQYIGLYERILAAEPWR